MSPSLCRTASVSLMLLNARMKTNINLTDRHGNTSLMLALKKRCGDSLIPLDTVYSFIDRGIDVNIQNKIGETALYLALKNYYDVDLSLVSKLIQAGADVNLKTKSGVTVLLRSMFEEVFDLTDSPICCAVVDAATSISGYLLHFLILLRKNYVAARAISCGKALPQNVNLAKDIKCSDVILRPGMSFWKFLGRSQKRVSPLFTAFLAKDLALVRFMISKTFLRICSQQPRVCIRSLNLCGHCAL